YIRKRIEFRCDIDDAFDQFRRSCCIGLAEQLRGGIDSILALLLQVSDPCFVTLYLCFAVLNLRTKIDVFVVTFFKVGDIISKTILKISWCEKKVDLGN